MKQNTYVELLAPCGSPEAVDAAIAGGADAVYLGGTLHNARMFARNFDDAALRAAIERCHDSRVAVYVTLNTQLYDRELGEALSYAHTLYEAGADALIVADLGFASLLHARLPDLPLHASTQVSGHNAQAAARLAALGFSRMVCAREMSRADIARLCAQSPIEIEQFVHGAHCASHSGQCLLSAVLGGRSGNRGRCAQPCRQSYNRAFPLSLKDLCLATHLTEVCASGVASLKIEGRMKHPDYVYGVTGLYRRLLNERRNATAAEVESLSRLFSRGGGFTDGYYTKKITPAMLGVRTDADKADTRRAHPSYRPIPRTQVHFSAPDRAPVPCAPFALPKEQACAPTQQTARFASPEQIPREHPFSVVYLPLFVYDRATEAQRKRANGVILPSVLYDCDLDAARAALARAKASGAQHVLCGNIGHLSLAKESGLAVHADFRANVCNRASLAVWRALGVHDAILSPELILPQIRDLGGARAVIVYGRLPLMLLERRLQTKDLVDRRGVRFPVRAEDAVPSGVRDVVYNSVPLYMADAEQSLRDARITDRHFIFTVESPEQVRAILAAYRNHAAPTTPVRRIGKSR